jgi:hypothetical protein
MKILRSVNRRGSTIGSAGYFSVLNSNTWFPASRLRESFGDSLGQSEGAALPHRPKPILAQEAPTDADNQETAMPLQILTPSTAGHRPIRAALIVLTAAAITLIMLCWIAQP